MSIESASGSDIDLPRGLAGFRRLLRLTGQVELVTAIIALIVVVVLSGAQAFLRYSIGASLWWAQEVAENTIMITYFLGISYVFKTRQYIIVEFVSSALPIRVQLVFYVIAQILAFVFTLAILYLVYLFSPTLLNMTTPVLRLPAIITPGPLIVASAMIALTSVYYLALAIWALWKGPVGHVIEDTELGGIILQPWVEEE